MTVTALNDIEVAWTEAGRGPTVVFVHGLAEDRTSWSAQQAALRDFHTYAYDLRGHGRTTVGSGTGDAEQLAADLIAFLENVSGPAVCVGFSLGGTLVLWAAALRADLVPRAIVLGTSSVVGRAAADFYRSRIETVSRGDRDDIRAALLSDTAAAIANPTVDVAAVTEYRLAAIGDGAGYMNAAAAMARVNESPLSGVLPLVRAHVDVIGGELDSFCPRRAADLILAGLPDADYREIPGVGHLMNVDDPGAVTTLLEDLVRKETQ